MLLFYFECKTYIVMLDIQIINKRFGMIPRLKHYKDVINVPFVEFRLKLNRRTI